MVLYSWVGTILMEISEKKHLQHPPENHNFFSLRSECLILLPSIHPFPTKRASPYYLRHLYLGSICLSLTHHPLIPHTQKNQNKNQNKIVKFTFLATGRRKKKTRDPLVLKGIPARDEIPDPICLALPHAQTSFGAVPICHGMYHPPSCSPAHIPSLGDKTTSAAGRTSKDQLPRVVALDCCLSAAAELVEVGRG